MKTIVASITLLLAASFLPNHVSAQAWERNSAVLSLGVGPSRFYHLGYVAPGYPGVYGNVYVPTTGQFNFQGEFGVHDYVGLGFTTGVGGRAGWGNNYLGEVNFPIGLLCNFHFYRLIDDKSSRDIHSDELDIYAGLSVGSGFAIAYYRNDPDQLVPLVFAGPHAGIRWWFSPRVGLNGEFGFGKSLANVGFVFKP